MVERNKIPEAYSLCPFDKENTNRYKVHVGSNDLENAPLRDNSGEFNPFTDRKINNPTTDCQTLTHLMKSTLGTGIMAMPYAFKSAGIIGGLLGGLLMAAVCTHTSYILIDCAHKLYYKTKKKKMDYPDVIEAAFYTGPEWAHKFSKFARYTAQIGIFSAYFGACSADNVAIATNYGQVIKYYTNFNTTANITDPTELLNAVNVELNLLRIIMSCLILPLILIVWVPDLKYLTPISTMANFFMAAVIGITFYYLAQDPLPIDKLPLVTPVKEFPQFFSITLFAMENIGVMMPLENNMKTPQNFLGTCGVLNRGMFVITFVYLLLGVGGYIKFGDNVSEIVTTNLPVNEIPAQIVKILIGSTVLFTFGLQFYVCREMAWNRVKHHFPNHPLIAEYVLRAILVIICVLIAIAIPKIGPLINLVGALGFSLLGIIGPAIIELITYWDIGFGRCNWKIFKNIFLLIFGVFVLIAGCYFSVIDIKRNILYFSFFYFLFIIWKLILFFSYILCFNIISLLFNIKSCKRYNFVHFHFVLNSNPQSRII